MSDSLQSPEEKISLMETTSQTGEDSSSAHTDVILNADGSSISEAIGQDGDHLSACEDNNHQHQEMNKEKATVEQKNVKKELHHVSHEEEREKPKSAEVLNVRLDKDQQSGCENGPECEDTQEEGKQEQICIEEQISQEKKEDAKCEAEEQQQHIEEHRESTDQKPVEENLSRENHNTVKEKTVEQEQIMEEMGKDRQEPGANLEEENTRQKQAKMEEERAEDENIDADIEENYEHDKDDDKVNRPADPILKEGLDFTLEKDIGLEEEKESGQEEKEVDGEHAEDEIEQVRPETETMQQEEAETTLTEDRHSMAEEMERESLENDKEPVAGEMQKEVRGQKEEMENNCVGSTVITTIVSEKGESTDQASVNENHTEEKMEVDLPKDSGPCSDMENETAQESKDAVVKKTSAVESEKKAASPPNSPCISVKIKDEPMDEEYEKALIPQAPVGSIKDEPDANEEFQQKTTKEIRISAVFSVGGIPPPTVSSSQTPAVAISVKASSSSSAPGPALTPASSLCVVCSGCKKVLLKGQTAFQRKGSPLLFCSPRCLCSNANAELAATPDQKKTCHYCFKDIPNPKDVIIAPVDSAKTVNYFCSQKCLGAFNYKRDSVNSILSAEGKSSKCSVCQKSCTTRHEVTFMGSVHRLCSDTCFNQFRSSNKLNMNCCVFCGGYCYSGDGTSQSLLMEGTVKKFCSQNCVTAFKKKQTKPVACTMCRAVRSVSEMVESSNSEGNRELFCSPACMTAHKVQTVSSSGAALECNNCKQVKVPQYHLAMSDGTIRNFCSFTCVVAFQDSFNQANPQNQLNVAPSLNTAVGATKIVPTKPAGSLPSSSGAVQVPPVTKIPCAQCQGLFFRKPELLDFKGKMYVFCDKACIDEFRRTNYIMAQCVYCKIDKVVKEVKRINSTDCSFCSEDSRKIVLVNCTGCKYWYCAIGCKLLYKHDLAKRWGKKHCRNCLYCNGTSQTVVSSVFAGKQEEFCGNECLSHYTLLFCQVAKCAMCKKARKMGDSVKWLGEIKHFCNLQCLMYFCSLQGGAAPSVKPSLVQVPISVAPVVHSVSNTMTTRTPLAPKEATPVIANVISLSNAPNGQPTALGSAALPGAVPPVIKVLGNASTQTDVLKPAPAAPPKILKNKALLCKPLNQNKGTSCKPHTCDMNIQTDEILPTVIPLPVPVFIPVPMHLYTQLTPYTLGLPLPVPVPMFLPTTLDSAERIVETIQKIKEKIPDNPLEADLIMMAEMVAEDSEKEKVVSQGDQDDNFIEDFDLEALSSWEEDSISSAPRWGRTSEPPKAPPSKPAQRTLSPPPEEPPLDLEADFPAESLELFAQRGQPEKIPPPPKQRGRRRGRDGFPQKKRGRKRVEAVPQTPTVLPAVSQLHHEYGVQAWKSWIRWRNTQPNVETPKIGPRSMTLKEDLLQCSTAELSYGLCRFISEVRRPNGETYSPDSIYYLCLGVQQYLFEKGRTENIFADVFYTKFCQNITSLLKDWKPTILPSGYVHSRVEEEYLWECKQLGAFSPSVLLNTLLFFFTKIFNFKTVAQHRRLSFAHVMRCTRTHSSGKVACLRFYPPVGKEDKANTEGGKRKREDEDEEGIVLEMQENSENPLRCPVRLYEFYLSKCSATVKQRTTVFYLRPERCCVPNSPLWFSSESLDDEELENMLTRILTVRELYLEREKPPTTFDSDSHSDSD